MGRMPARFDGDNLDYLHAMLGELRALAEGGKQQMLAYLIDMAYIEAGDLIRARHTPAAEKSGIGKKERDGAS